MRFLTWYTTAAVIHNGRLEQFIHDRYPDEVGVCWMLGRRHDDGWCVTFFILGGTKILAELIFIPGTQVVTL